MKRRIIAWILLIGFVALLVNLMTVRIFPIASFTVYIAVVLCFIFVFRKGNNKEF